MMKIEGENEQGAGPSSKVRILFSLLAVLLACFALALFGSQLAFLARLPHLSALARDPQAMWLVFSTWPEIKFVTVFNLLLATHHILPGLSRKGITPARMLRRIGSWDRPAIVAVIGISVFFLPLVFAVPFVLLFLLIMLSCLVICSLVIDRLIFMAVHRAGVPLPTLWICAALPVGFFGNLLMSWTDHNSFSCRAGAVQLRSGEELPCSNLVSLRGKPLWLVEGPQGFRLVLDTDFNDYHSSWIVWH